MRLQDSAGNTHSLLFQGRTFPVPDDDIMSCEGLEGPNNEHVFEEINAFADALQPMEAFQSPQWDCRAASGSHLHHGISAPMCAGDNAQAKADTDTSGALNTTYDGEQSSQGGYEHSFTNFDVQGSPIPENLEPAVGAPHGRDFISILGGASSTEDTFDSATQKTTGMQNYATATDCILQNLTMVVQCTLESLHLGMCASPRD